MVMVMILIFLITGSHVERVDRWVITGLTAATVLVLIVTYLRF